MPRRAQRNKNERRPRTTTPRRPLKQLEGVTDIDYKYYEFLRKFMTERGKIMPGRMTGANAKQQRQIKRAIRRARVMGMLP